MNFAVEVAHDKYLLHSPLERQAREMTRQGLVIDSQTLWDQLWGLGQLVEPAYHALHRHVLSGPWVHADETTWQLLGHRHLPSEVKAGEWYVWVAHRPGAAFYLIQPKRDEHGARELLTCPSWTPQERPGATRPTSWSERCTRGRWCAARGGLTRTWWARARGGC